MPKKGEERLGSGVQGSGGKSSVTRVGGGIELFGGDMREQAEE